MIRLEQRFIAIGTVGTIDAKEGEDETETG